VKIMTASVMVRLVGKVQAWGTGGLVHPTKAEDGGRISIGGIGQGVAVGQFRGV